MRLVINNNQSIFSPMFCLRKEGNEKEASFSLLPSLLASVRRSRKPTGTEKEGKIKIFFGGGGDAAYC